MLFTSENMVTDFINIFTGTLWYQCLLHHDDVKYLNGPIL